MVSDVLTNVNINGNFNTYHATSRHLEQSVVKLSNNTSISNQCGFVNIVLRPNLTYYFKVNIILNESVMHKQHDTEDKYNRTLLNIYDDDEVQRFKNIYSNIKSIFEEHLNKSKNTKSITKSITQLMTNPILDISEPYSDFMKYLQTFNGIIIKAKLPKTSDIKLDIKSKKLVGLKFQIWQNRSMCGISLIIDKVY